MPLRVHEKAKSAGRAAKGKAFSRNVFMYLAIGQALIIVPLVVFGFYMAWEMTFQRYGLKQPGIYLSLKKTYESVINARFPVTRILGFNGDFPSINLDIKLKNYRKLEYASASDSTLDTLRRMEIKVPAVLRVDNDAVPVRVRLKGDRRSQWTRQDRWSFRVKTRKGKTFMGMKRFSLHKAVIRNYAYEWVFQQLLRYEGLISIRYRFVNLSVNGASRGVYALEEHFGKQLIENNDRRDGPIVYYSEDWLPGSTEGTWRKMPVKVYEAQRWKEQGPEMAAHAAALLEGFRDGRLRIGDVFDIDKMAKYFAVCDLLKTYHGAIPKSVKFYYNPVTSKLEPIGFDGHFNDKDYPVLIPDLTDWKVAKGFWGYGLWFRRFFGTDAAANVSFLDAYFGHLERMSAPEYLSKFLDGIADELDRNLDFIYSEFPVADLLSGHPKTGMSPMFSFSRSTLERIQSSNRRALTSDRGFFAFVEEAGDEYIDVRMKNVLNYPLEVARVTFGGRSYLPRGRLLLNGRRRPEALQASLELDLGYRSYRLYLAPPASETEDKQKPEDAVFFHAPGVRAVIEKRLTYWHRYFRRQITKLHNPTGLKVPADEVFLDIDHVSRTVNIKAGSWRVERPIVIPKGYRLNVPAGVTLDLTNKAHIVSFGPVHFSGTKEEPVTITSSDGTGRGLLVIGAGERSLLSHTVFSKLKAQDDPRLVVSGVLTFYESDVYLENVVFEDNAAEDALNIISSKFGIKGGLFKGSKSDAFDADFSDGVIENTRFVDTGNDAIDISGSHVLVRDVRISGVGDKGLSVGERSSLEADRVYIDGANIGVAVKDGSMFKAHEINFTETALGIAVFRKKGEYQHASAEVWRYSLENVAEFYRLERGSILILNGDPVPPNGRNVSAELYPEKAAN